MKKNLFKLSWLVLAVLIGFTACTTDDDDDDDDDNGTTLVEDGFYLKGAATALTDLSSTGQLKVTRNEVVQENRSDLMEIYVAVQGGTDGFNLIEVAGAEQKVYGPGTDFIKYDSTNLDGEEPTLGLWKGSVVESETPFTVEEDGLYHVIIDKELMVAAIAKVEWGIIGAATPGGWSGSTQFTEGTFDLNTISFEITDLELTKADYKFRYSNGWKIILDAEYDLGGGDKGIKVNTNFGGAVDALVPGGDNINNDVPGKYTVNMTWTLADGYTATVTKTGDSEIKDYSTTELGLVGNGIVMGDSVAGWSTTVYLHTPEASNTKYTWSWDNVQVTDTGSFKIREGQDWEGVVIGYGQVTMAGGAADDFTTNGDGNFVPTVSGAYDITLEIEASTESYTVTVETAGTPDPELYLLGSATAAGWDNTLALPMAGTGGEYTITATLTSGTDMFIKFIEVLGQWAPQYGTDADGTWASGNLVYRETEDEADPPAIPAPDADGDYLITVNTNDLTYTVVAATK